MAYCCLYPDELTPQERLNRIVELLALASVPGSNGHRKHLAQINAELGSELTTPSLFIWDSSYLPREEQPSLAGPPLNRSSEQLELWSRI